MMIRQLNLDEWQELLAKSLYQTPFHGGKILCLFIKNLGGAVDFYLVENAAQSWIVPVVSGEPWAEKGAGFVTSCVGYGGPLPLHKVLNAEQEKEEVLKCLQALAEECNQSFLRAILYPARFWQEKQGSVAAETLIVDLPSDSQEAFENIISGNARNAIRRAQKHGVVVEAVTGDSPFFTDGVSLIQETQARLKASYMTSPNLIKDLLAHPDVFADFYVAIFEGRAVASALLLKNPIQSFHWLHGWQQDYAITCANQLLIWQMMQASIAFGSSSLNLGSSHKESQKRAKRQWGAMPIYVETLSREMM